MYAEQNVQYIWRGIGLIVDGALECVIGGGEADYERILWNRLGQFLMRAFAGDELSLAQLRQSAGCVRLRQIFRGAAHKRL